VGWRRWKTIIPEAALAYARNEFQTLLLSRLQYVLCPHPERSRGYGFDDQLSDHQGAWFDHHVAPIYLRCCADSAGLLWDETLRRQTKPMHKELLEDLHQQIVSIWPGICLTSGPEKFNEKFARFLDHAAVMDHLVNRITAVVRGKCQNAEFVLEAIAVRAVDQLIERARHAQSSGKPFKFLLKAAGLTEIEIARALGVHRSQISRFTRGFPKALAPPHVEEFFKFAATKLRASR
jgi:hypothetical protein